jgi:precorrin-6B C5,15-methyltransferase / cobalt-precorrin-6B C5,C15-methyltransferase
MIPQTQDIGPSDWRPPLVALIGIGMGKEDLSLRASRWIDRAEVLAGGTRHLDLFPDHTADMIAIESPLEAFFERIGEVSEAKRTAVLASGDPFFFGIGSRLVKHLGRDRVLAIPNVSAVQSLFARLGESWEDVRVMSLHGRAEAQTASWLRELRRRPRMVLFTDPHHTPAWIARQLLDAGFSDRILVVAEDLGLPTEYVAWYPLDEARDRSFSPLNLVAILPAADSSEGAVGADHMGPVLGLAEEAFRHEAGLITKLEVRAVVLAYLQIEPGLVMWDLGAGSGSVSIEAARMAALKQVFAVERDPARFSQLVENVKRFRCFEIQPICGSAPEPLNLLPDPDRVFIGGSGTDLECMLQQVAARLRPGGRVVQTMVTLDTLETARSFWQGKPFDLNIAQLQVSRAVPIGKSLRLEPLNPVFIITVWRRP